MSGLYYGWVITAGCFLCCFSFGIFNSFGVFFTSLETEFGWSATLVSSIIAAHHIGYFFSSIIIGWLTDKIGPRVPLLLAALLIGTCISMLSLVQHIYQFYLFYFIASLGCTVSWTLCLTIVQRWFIKNSGVAVGIVTSGMGIGILFYSALAGHLITVYGWRVSFVCLGVFTGLLLFLCSFIVVAPEQKKITVPVPEPAAEKNSVLESTQWEYLKAIRTRAFALITLCQICIALPMFILTTHMVRFVELAGIEKTTAAETWGLVGVTCMLGGLISPFIAERTIGWTKMLTVCAFCAAASFIWLVQAHTLWMIYVFTVVFGLGHGGCATLIPLIVRKNFGTVSLSRIIGTVMSISTICAIVGPVLAGYIVDVSGSYIMVFFIGAALLFITALTGLLIKPPVQGTQVTRPLG